MIKNQIEKSQIVIVSNPPFTNGRGKWFYRMSIMGGGGWGVGV